MTKVQDKDVKSPTANLLAEYLDSSNNFSQLEVAQFTGMGDTGNIITQIRKGRTKLPIKYIVPICKLLHRDPTELLETAIKEYHPDILSAISNIKGEVIDQDEQQLIELYRASKEKVKEAKVQEVEEAYKQECIQAGEPIKERVLRKRKQEVSLQLSRNKAEKERLKKALLSSFEVV